MSAKGAFRGSFALGLAVVVALAGCQPSDGAGNIGHSRHAVMIPNGIAANGLGTNGIALNGIALNGIGLDGILLNGVTLDADPTLHGDFMTLLGYLASCALPAGSCIQAKDLDGSTLTYCGADGIDPGTSGRPGPARARRRRSSSTAEEYLRTVRGRSTRPG